MSSTVEHFQCMIIGSGPSGYTAAIYAARANLKPVVFTGMEPGGQLMQTTDVENYPGYQTAVTGPEMMNDFQKQAERFGTDVRYKLIKKVDFTGPIHKAWDDAGTEYTADSIIVSTGASAKWLGLDSEKRLAQLGGGVSACAVCDGFFYKGQDVIVVGGGDTAAEEALYLAKLCPQVHLLVRKDHMRASKIMVERVEKAENITVHWNTETIEVLGEKLVEGAKVINNITKEESTINVSGFFVAIGHKPNSDPFKGWLTLDDAGYVVTEAGSSKTNIEGVFAGGDIQDKIYRQAVTAAGSGCMAALDAERYLAEKGII